MTRETAISYWCLPCSDDAARVQPIVDRLTHAQGAPPFQAHMTLGSRSSELEHLDPLRRSLRGLALGISGIGQSTAFTTSLVLRLELTSQIAQARAQFEAFPGFRKGRAFEPHLSLCYGAPPIDAALDPGIQQLVGVTLRFDRLAVMQIELPVETYTDVSAWKLLDVVNI